MARRAPARAGLKENSSGRGQLPAMQTPAHSQRLMAAVREGSWLTPGRVRGYAIILLLAYAGALGFLVFTATGNLDFMGRPLGTDFADVWTAGKLAISGHPALAYDPPAHYATQQAAFGRAAPYYGWHYPPFFLLAASALARLPYAAAVLAWQAATLPLYLLAMRAAAPRRETLLMALAFPGVYLNLTHGQNGFLSAALITGGLLLLDRRPLVAGMLFGLVAYKPQFGVYLPLLLLATGRWRAFAAAAATVLGLAGAATLAFGPQIWPAFIGNMAFTRHEVLEQGGTGFHKIQSVFAAVRLWGGPIGLAYVAQAAVTLAAGVGLIVLWRRPADARLKGAALLAGSLLATPYCLDYDLMLLGPALALYAAYGLERGFRPFEASLLAFVFFAPAITRESAHALLIPVGLIATLTLFAMVLRRGLQPAGGAAPSLTLERAVAA